MHAAIATFEQRGEPWPLPPSVESALLRIGQEALVNVAKHSGATQVEVVLEYTPDDVRLSIADNGVGFDEAAVREHRTAAAPWTGFGLLGMRERIAALGGILELTSDRGARVLAVVPRHGAGREPAPPERLEARPARAAVVPVVTARSTDGGAR